MRENAEARDGTRNANGSANEKGSGVEPVLILKSCAMFMDLEAESLVPLARHTRTLTLAAGERVETRASDERRVYFVHQGVIAACGANADTRKVGSGETCGFIRCLAGAPGDSTIEAASAAVVLEATRSDLITALDESFAIQQAVVSYLGRSALELRHVLPPLPRFARRVETGDAAPDLGAQIRLLSETQALGGLRVHALGQLALGGTLERFASGEMLWERGDAADSCVLVLDGELERLADGGVREVLPGSLAGLSESLARTERPDGARATRDALVLRLRVDQFYDTIEDDPEATRDLISVLARGVLGAQQFHDARPAPGGSAEA